MKDNNNLTVVPPAKRGQPTSTAKVFPFRRHDGHILFDVDGRVVLLDTGCGESLGEGSIAFLGEERRLSPSQGSITCQQLSGFVGTRIDVLMGVDLIGLDDIRLNLEEGTLSWGRLDPDEGCPLGIDTFLGAPVLEVSIGGERVQAFFDTGAVTTYVDKELVHGQVSVGTREDFFPTKGTFTANLFELSVSFAGQEMELVCGEMPTFLQDMLCLAGARALIGMDVLEHCDFGLSLQQRELHLFPRSG